MKSKINWEEELKPLIKKYKGRTHPLQYQNLYQLMVMVVLSAQTTDLIVNAMAPKLFEAFPDMASLARASPDSLFPFIAKVRGFGKKAEWLIKIAQQIKTDKNIPLTMQELVKYPGIGRKSANVIMREGGAKAEGVIVDLHVVRVAPRIGITKEEDPTKIEKDIMNALLAKQWSDVGMAISFLGREICRPTDPKHSECPINNVCVYYANINKKKGKMAKA